MKAEDVIPELLSHLQEKGFRRSMHQPSGGSLELTGPLIVEGREPIECKLSVDRRFRVPPRITLLSIPESLQPVSPHLGPNGELCYAAKGTYVVDIHNPVNQTLAFISLAEKVLNSVLNGEMEADLAEEFYSFWGSELCFSDIESSQTGKLQVFSHSPDDNHSRAAFILTDDIEKTARKLNSWSGRHEKIDAPVYSISTRAEPRPSLKTWPPSTISELLIWQRTLDGNVSAKILKRLREAYQSEARACLFVISSPRFRYGFLVTMPDSSDRKSPRDRTGIKHLYSLKVLPIALIRIDDTYLIERNTPDTQSLANLDIAVVGCGTIGGFFAELAVKAGAGTGTGRLSLVDPEILEPSNLGRHRLGFADLFQSKAKALQGELERVMPSASIRAIPNDIRDVELEKADIIVDLTGDESLGYWIADRFQDKCPILSVWVEGPGIATRTLLKRPGKGACFRCLCDVNREGYLKSVEEDFGEVFAGHGCEGLYVPFPATVSIQAACLGIEAITDWADASLLPSLRTRITNPGYTKSTNDCSPIHKENCPACCT